MNPVRDPVLWLAQLSHACTRSSHFLSLPLSQDSTLAVGVGTSPHLIFHSVLSTDNPPPAAEKEEKEIRRQAKLGNITGGQATTKPLVDGEDETAEQREYYHAHHVPGEHLEETEGGSLAPAGENKAPCDLEKPTKRPSLLAPLKSNWKGAPGGKHRRKMSPHLEVM